LFLFFCVREKKTMSNVIGTWLFPTKNAQNA
jgi:hypothetical protein